MTKRDLVTRISRETGIAQEDVYAVIQNTLDYITDALAEGDHIEFRDFGVFEVCTRKARIGRNPNKPEHVVQIPERHVVKFKPGKRMKALVGKTAVQPGQPAQPEQPTAPVTPPVVPPPATPPSPLV